MAVKKKTSAKKAGAKKSAKKTAPKRMTLKQAMARLKSLGTAQTRKTYGRHGVTGEMFGVKYGDLEKLVREIKVDHELAVQLWETGNHDARALAAKIIDPAKLKASHFNAWIKDVDNHVLSYTLAGIARCSEAGRKRADRWMQSKNEWAAATGWNTVSGRLNDGETMTKAAARKMLADIEKCIHDSPNRVKYSMNSAMIAIGAYLDGMEKEAIKVATRIGQVEVDHGLTNCKTPFAVPYIKKAAAHHRGKLAKLAAKKKASAKKAKSTAKKKATA